MIYLIDAFVFGQGGVAFFASLIVWLCSFVGMLISLFTRNREMRRHHALRAGIYFLMLICVVITVATQNGLAQGRAEKLVQACQAYKVKYNKFPDRLEELVPEFIPKIPPAKYTLMFNRFIYTSSDENRHTLFYAVVPPFGRRYYRFEEGSWGMLD